VRSERLKALALAVGIGCGVLACSSSPPPETAAPPPSPATPPDKDTGFTGIISGSEDSVAALPGSPDALYRFRFRQIDPASDKFTFQDRDLSFYFRPAPSALHFRVENRQDRPVWIEWDRSTFYPPTGRSGKVAHASTRWVDRYRVQPPTQIAGLQRYGDYVLPLDYLLDPAGADEQLHRPLLREDHTATQFEGNEFGVDLVIRVEDRFRTYPFRFRVESVLPR
jgi:hypothetical protein